MRHIVYKITNVLSGKFYIGVHSTADIDDSYMGSGKIIKAAISKHGVHNFKKEILSEWESRNLALEEEARLVEPEEEGCYNLIPGGGAPPRWEGENHPLYGSRRSDSSERMKRQNPSKLPHVREFLKNTAVGILGGVTGRYRKDDPRWKSGEISSINKGKITVRDLSGNIFHVTKDDPRWKSGEIVHVTKGSPRTKAQLEKKQHRCPNCGHIGKGGAMKRWHFDNCKRRIL